jgi:hypothetical protein
MNNDDVSGRRSETRKKSRKIKKRVMWAVKGERSRSCGLWKSEVGIDFYFMSSFRQRRRDEEEDVQQCVKIGCFISQRKAGVHNS